MSVCKGITGCANDSCPLLFKILSLRSFLITLPNLSIPHMKIKTFLLAAVITLIVIILSGKTALYYYWAALVITVSYLNSRTAFLQGHYQVSNALFLMYLLFVVWERTRHIQFSPPVEWQINNSEHVLFGMMVCFIASLVLQLPPFTTRSFYVRLPVSILIFNSIGFINEWFQNWLYARPVFTLIPDSLKDLRMNVWGTAIFVLLSVGAYWFNSERKTRIAVQS